MTDELNVDLQYGGRIGGFLSKMVVSREEKVVNQKRLEELVESWKKLEEKYPDLTKTMVCGV